MTVPITSNGEYLVKVDGDGYVATEEAFDVACDITKCESCNPTFVLPVSPKLGSDAARIMLSWANLPNELQLSSFERGCEEIDTDFSGDDIDAVFDVKSSQACSEICKNKEGCTHWTWVGETYIKNPSMLHSCLLKNGNAGRRKETGLVSGKGGCVEYKCTAESLCQLLDTDLAGNDIEAALDVPSWEECSDLCSKKRGCTVWTWVDSSYTINTEIINKCHLKDGSPGPSSVTGLVSGSAGCKPVEECENTVSFSLLPAGKTDKIEIVLNWGEKASNLDLHTMQINKEAPGAGCETFFNKMVGCENTQLDVDKFNGGADGGEKITISNPAENLKYTYMIFVKDNSADTDELETSEAHIDISDGTKSLSKTLPKFNRNTPSGANFWFVGCLRTVGESFEFASVDTLSRDSPYLTEKLFCDNLFKKDLSAGQEKSTEFCEDINLKVRLQTEQNSAYDSLLASASCPTCSISSVQIVSVKNDAQKTIFEGVPEVVPRGAMDTVTVPITNNGQYLVKVEGDGYVATEITKCGSCKPLFVVPLSQTLRSDEARIMIS